MALFSKNIESMQDLFLHTLQDIYYAEKKITSALPKMIDKAQSAALRTAFESHLEETRGHVARLEQAFGMLGQTAKGVTCPAIDGIVEEAEDVTGDVGDAGVMDAALAAAAQTVEHYEMARYGTLLAWANELDRPDLAELFAATLKEEKAADATLTNLAEDRLNQAA